MNIYLVRHGETKLNIQKIHQLPETELSEYGLVQAQTLSEVLKELNIDVVFSSPLKRAMQTTEAFANSLNKVINPHEALKEIQRPTVIMGKSHNDPDVINIKKEIREHYHLPDWKHSDEENFADLKNRIEQFKNWIITQSYKNILLVSHGMSIKMFIALVIFGNKLEPYDFLDFYNNTSLSNVSLSLCTYTDSRWKLEYMNNTTHLRK